MSALNVFERRFVNKAKGPALWGGLTFEHDATGAECSRVLQPARIQQKPNNLEKL